MATVSVNGAEIYYEERGSGQLRVAQVQTYPRLVVSVAQLEESATAAIRTSSNTIAPNA